MLSAIPPQYHLFIGIGGLIFLLLVLTGVAQRYQAYQLQKQAALRRILRGVQQIENILAVTEGCAISKKLHVLLRKEILARYMAVHQIHKRLDNLKNSIAQAQQRLSAAESRSEFQLSKPSDRTVYNHYLHGLSELINFLKAEGHIAGMNEAGRKLHERELVALRANYVSLFHTGEANLLIEKQQWNAAGKHMKEALHILQHYGSSDVAVRELYKEANQFYREILDRQAEAIILQRETARQQSEAESAGNG